MNKKIKSKIAVFVALVSLLKNSCFASEGVSNNNNDFKALVSGIAVSKSGDKVGQDKKKVLTKGEIAAGYAILFSVWFGPPLLIFGLPTYLILDRIAKNKIKDIEKKLSEAKNKVDENEKKEFDLLFRNRDKIQKIKELEAKIAKSEENELKKSSYSLLDKFFETNWEFQTKSLLSQEEIFCNYDNHVKENRLLSKNEQAKSHFNLAKDEWKNNKEKYEMKVYYDDYEGRDYVTVVAIKKEVGFEIKFCFSYNRETKEPALILFANKIKGKYVCLWEWRAVK